MLAPIEKKPIKISKITKVKGEIKIAGDKSISHRSFMLASQTIGVSKIYGVLEAEDVMNTIYALTLLGVEIYKDEQEKCWIVKGQGIGSFREPENILYMGNSGTSTRLLMGLVSSQPIKCFFSGDKSLNNRPMMRVVSPLESIGATCITRNKGKLPLVIIGTDNPSNIEYEMPVASAQVKSAILFSALNIKGHTKVIENIKSRDHSEIMLKYLGFDVTTESKDGKYVVTISGDKECEAKDIIVPADPSSAAFFVALALLVPNSDILLKNICVNDTRIGFYEIVKEMGGNIVFVNERIVCGEKIADINVKYSHLKNITIPEYKASSMIDEYPIISILAACSSGKMIMRGLEELKVKESNRLLAIFSNLVKLGVKTEMGDDYLIIEGSGKYPKGGISVETNMDHRIAMSFSILSAVCDSPIEIDDVSSVATSFPEFFDIIKTLLDEI